jgi:hypothetical protein
MQKGRVVSLEVAFGSWSISEPESDWILDTRQMSVDRRGYDKNFASCTWPFGERFGGLSLDQCTRRTW